MRELRAAGRRYLVDGSGVRAVEPEPDRGLRLVLDGREITAADLAATEIDPRPGGGLRWRLVGAGLVVGVEVSPSGAAARVDVEVSGAGRLGHVEVERWARGPGLGQPAMGSGWFAALEHPGAEDLGLAVDADLRRGPYRCPTVVVGRAAPGHELGALWDELDRVRARPPRLVALANNWYQLGSVGRMDGRTVAAELEGFAAVGARHGLDLDWYCLDDPWDGAWSPATGLWGRLDPGRFPGGLPSGLPIGLWVSPWGGYFDRHDARVEWGAAHGYEVQDGPWPRLCPAGDRYRRHLAESLVSFSRRGVGYWKLDGVQFDCDDPGHGHPTGPGGRTAQMDRFAALLDEVRAARPDAVLAFTTGSNPSPWWLCHADFVWRGGLDDDAPDEYPGGRHERFATYIDGCLHLMRDSAVPVSAVVTFSVVENSARAYRDETGGPGGWERHCWLLAARGTLHHDLYVAPDSLSGPEWDALARALAWARRHQHVLARSRMVGGRPQAGEVYGFLSVGSGGEAVLCLRNPAAAAQAVPASLTSGLTGASPVWGRLDDGLEPFGVAVVTGRWTGPPPGAAGPPATPISPAGTPPPGG